MRVVVKIWLIAAITYLGMLAMIVYWPIVFNELRALLNYLNRVSGGIAIPGLIVMVIAGSIATIYVYGTVIIHARREPVALVVGGGTMYSSMLKSSSERQARRSLSRDLNPPGNVKVVLFSPSQRDLGMEARRVI